MVKFKKNNTDSSPPGRGAGAGHIVPIIIFEFYQLCKHTLICLTIISVLFAVSSCSVKGYKPITETEKSKIFEPHIFTDDFEKALYKTSIEIYGNSLTGLTLIKRTDSAIRVVSMSEMGMKYFDLEFPLNRIELTKVHYIMKPLDKKMFINLLDRDFRLLLFYPEVKCTDILINEQNNGQMLVRYKKLVYFFDSSGAISEISNRQSLTPIISVSSNLEQITETIKIEHRKTIFEFERLNDSITH